MIINVPQISEDEGLSIKQVYPEGEPRLRGEDARLVGRTAVDITLTRRGETVRIRGTLSATVEFDCDRCLAPLSRPVSERLDLKYVPPLKGVAPGEEKELDYEDLAVAFYQNDVIDIDDLVREQVELTLPMSRICRDDCLGLCQNCGANLNEGPCSCSTESPDPRWAALRELKFKH